MDGIELAGILQERGIPVIFLTANSDDATFDQAKKAKPYAFLSKPVEKRDLKRVLELAVNLYAGKGPSAAEQKEDLPAPLADRLFVYDGDKRVKLLFDSILYIQAERNYCRIATREKEYLLSMPMKSLESELPASLFQRIHRSYIVNIRQVEEVEDASVRIGKSKLPMSQSYRKDFLLRIKLV
jgi:DNA-binding LytR/AlgR family response regulator